MASQRLRPGDGPNIVPIPDPAKRFDPLYLEAHSLVDRVPRDRLWRLIPLLRDNKLAQARTVLHSFLKQHGIEEAS